MFLRFERSQVSETPPYGSAVLYRPQRLTACFKHAELKLTVNCSIYIYIWSSPKANNIMTNVYRIETARFFSFFNNSLPLQNIFFSSQKTEYGSIRKKKKKRKERVWQSFVRIVKCLNTKILKTSDRTESHHVGKCRYVFERDKESVYFLIIIVTKGVET